MTYAKSLISPTYLLLFTAAAYSSHALADTVWLLNGDKVTGTVTLLDNNKLFVKTDYAGTISLDWSKVKTFQTEKSLIVSQEKYKDGEMFANVKPGNIGEVIVHKDGVDRSMPLSSISAVMVPKPMIRDFSWKGNIDVGLSHKDSSTQTDNYDVSVNTNARHGTLRHNLKGDYHYEKDDGIVSTNNYNAGYALDKFVSSQLFIQGSATYKHDWIEEIKVNQSYGVGPGYQFWDDELGAFSLTSLISRQSYTYREDNLERENFYTFGGKWAYNKYVWAKTVQVFTNGSISRSFDETSSMDLDAELGLRYKLTDWASMNMKVTKDRVISENGSIDDTLYTMGVGVGW
jgi:hypothetical protein